MAVITITGEYGTGSRKLTTQLAGKTGYEYIGKELLHEVAKELRLTESEVEMFRKASQSRLIRMLDRYTCSLVQKVVDREHGCLDDHDFHEANTKLVEKLYNAGKVIIHNWGAQCILSGRPDTVHVRLTCDREKKIQAAQSAMDLDYGAARKFILDEEHNLAQYIKQFFHADWNDKGLYDLVIDTGDTSLTDAVDKIAAQLQTSTDGRS